MYSYLSCPIVVKTIGNFKGGISFSDCNQVFFSFKIKNLLFNHIMLQSIQKSNVDNDLAMCRTNLQKCTGIFVKLIFLLNTILKSNQFVLKPLKTIILQKIPILAI